MSIASWQGSRDGTLVVLRLIQTALIHERLQFVEFE
jgi:hypothetical protein